MMADDKKMRMLVELDENDKLHTQFAGTADFAIQGFAVCIAQNMFEYFKHDKKFGCSDALEHGFVEAISEKVYSEVSEILDRLFGICDDTFDEAMNEMKGKGGKKNGGKEKK